MSDTRKATVDEGATRKVPDGVVMVKVKATAPHYDRWNHANREEGDTYEIPSDQVPRYMQHNLIEVSDSQIRAAVKAGAGATFNKAAFPNQNK